MSRAVAPAGCPNRVTRILAEEASDKEIISYTKTYSISTNTPDSDIAGRNAIQNLLRDSFILLQ